MLSFGKIVLLCILGGITLHAIGARICICIDQKNVEVVCTSVDGKRVGR